MDIRKFLTTEEKVAGVAISDSKISIAFLKSLLRIKGKSIVIENLKEINLSEGIIEQGVVKNKTALISAFKKLILDLYTPKKIPKVLPAILSFPSQKVYSQLFDFPDRMTYDRLEESMKLTIGFSLPLKAEDCYLDWETISFEEKKVFLALIKKEIIDSYLEVLNRTPILPIACELYPLSLNRIISSFEENPFCLAFIDSQGVEVGISKGKTLRFMEGLYWKDRLSSVEMQKVEEKMKIAEELILKTINFYQTDKTDSGFIEKIYLIGEFSEIVSTDTISPFSKSLKERSGKEVIIPKIPFGIEAPKKIEKIKSKILKLTNLENKKKKELKDSEKKNKKEISIEKLKAELEKLQKSKKRETEKISALEISQIDQASNRFLVTFGVALRGLIPKVKDIFISLLPVGTEERYTKSRVVSLLNFVRNWAAVIGLVLIVLFAGVYFLVSKFNSNIEKELVNLQVRLVTEELQKIESTASEFNKNIALMESLEKEISNWSELLEELNKNKVSGITFTGLEVKSFQKEIILKGTAKKREDLLDFRDNLIKSEFFTDVEIPIKTLEKAEEVPFTINFKI